MAAADMRPRVAVSTVNVIPSDPLNFRMCLHIAGAGNERAREAFVPRAIMELNRMTAWFPATITPPSVIFHAHYLGDRTDVCTVIRVVCPDSSTKDSVGMQMHKSMVQSMVHVDGGSVVVDHGGPEW